MTLESLILSAIINAKHKPSLGELAIALPKETKVSAIYAKIHELKNRGLLAMEYTSWGGRERYHLTPKGVAMCAFSLLVRDAGGTDSCGADAIKAPVESAGTNGTPALASDGAPICFNCDRIGVFTCSACEEPICANHSFNSSGEREDNGLCSDCSWRAMEQFQRDRYHGIRLVQP